MSCWLGFGSVWAVALPVFNPPTTISPAVAPEYMRDLRAQTRASCPPCLSPFNRLITAVLRIEDGTRLEKLGLENSPNVELATQTASEHNPRVRVEMPRHRLL